MATVLVVDDNRDLADNLTELLRGEGAATTAAYGTAEALDHIAQNPCDLAIIDIRMPETDGLALLAELKHRCPDAEVIIMTANASLHTAVNALHEGAFAYLEKPFDPQQLLTLSERALTQIALRRERSRLQDDLRRSEALYREVVDGVDGLIVGIGRGGRIVMCNHGIVTALGYSRQALLQERFAALAASDTVAERLTQAVESARDDHKLTDLELTLRSLDGRERITRWTLSSLEPVGAAQPIVLGVGRDVTDRLDLERRAAEAEAMASIATLTAGLAHEIRNPLNAAALQLQLLERNTAKVDDPETRDRIVKRVGIVEAELARLTNLLDDFLNLAKPQRLSLAPLPLRQILSEVHALQEPTARKAGLALVLEPVPDGVDALADHGSLTQVLVNLVMNAIDALAEQPGGTVTLRGFSQGDTRVGIEVCDNGPGIPEAVAETLFAPFVTSKEAGTGLGLTIVKRIVDRHGGSIQVTSPGGRGTTARISLQRSVPTTPIP